ncbi:unnamed protein product [Dicrocoelium dendriticum]|nr:unnamed protein product [Dicrocoelium dendriticum]
MVDQYISRSQWEDIVGDGSYYSYDNFRRAAARERESGFLRVGGTNERKRELAAFLANCAHETGNFYHITEVNRSGQPYGRYYGRGPIQLTWDFNYGAFSEHYYGNRSTLLNDPDRVSEDGEVGFASAIWFWMTQPNSNKCAHTNIYRSTCSHSNWGFGRTIMAINGDLEGGAVEGGSREKDKQVTSRIRYYRRFADKLGTSVGNNGEQLDTHGM